MSRSTSLNTSVPARDAGYQNVQAITKTIAYNTLGIGTADTVIIGTIPAGAQILETIVRVTTAFNGGSNSVIVGSTSSNNDLVALDDFDATTVNASIVPRGSGLALTADTTYYVKYSQTGTAATTGAAVITITYFPAANG